MIALLKKDSGIAMPVVVAVIAIITLLGFTSVALVENQGSMGKRYEKSESALSVAEAGVNEYLWRLNKDSRFYATPEGIDFVNDGGVPREHEFQNSDGIYTLEITEPTAADPTVKIKSTGWIKGDENSKYAVDVDVRKRRFVQQIYLSGDEKDLSGEEVWWTTGDVVNGPFHTNGTLNIKGTPQFYGRVTYSNKVNGPNSGSNFHEGPPEKVEPLAFPLTNKQLKIQAKYNGYYFNGRTSIMLDGNSIKIKNKDNSVQTITDLKNGVIYIDGKVYKESYDNEKKADKWDPDLGNVFVSGKLNGRLTIAAANDIYITGYDPTIYNWNSVKNNPTGGIMYYDTDFTFDEYGNVVSYSDGDDMLGLVADQRIRILHYGWFGTNSGSVALNSITIHAAIFALNKSYEFENHTQGDFDTIKLVGSICQNRRGAVGTFNRYTGESESGYAHKNYSHDPRMAYDTPPHFLEPTNAGWEIVTWKKVSP
jgi:hypothetical protein